MDRVVGFSLSAEQDVGSAVAYDSVVETLFFGSPSADNSGIRSQSPGRMYVKAYCFPNRFGPGSLVLLLSQCCHSDAVMSQCPNRDSLDAAYAVVSSAPCTAMIDECLCGRLQVPVR